MKKDYLLLLSCSSRKIQEIALLPAIERYDGGSFRIIKKMQREEMFPANIDIKIISAKYGLIDAKKPIPDYEHRMNNSRILELKDQIQSELNQILSKKYFQIYIDLGHTYLTSLSEVKFSEETNILISKGRIGERLSNLKKWLLSLHQV